MTTRPPLRWLLPGFVAVALICRTPITSVPPALGAIRHDLALSPTLAGLTTTLPLVCFGVFAFATPLLVARWGTERTLLAALVTTVIGIGLRVAPTVAAFYLGTLLVGLGIAVMNVVLPAIVRERYPDSVPRRMALYTVAMIAGASLAAAATAPLMSAGVRWPTALALWAVPAAVATAVWAAAAREIHQVTHQEPGHHDRPSGMAHVVRRPRTWLAAVFMGTQSLCFYVPLTWIPDILRADGAGTGTAGLMLAVYMGLGIPGSYVGPFMATGRRAVPVLAAYFAAYAAAVLGLLGGLAPALASVVVMGFAQGASIAIALTFIAHAGDARDVPAVSAFSQGLGFLLAAVGPVVAGAAYEATGGWTVPVLLLLAVNLAQAGSGLLLAYPGRHDEDL